MKRYRYILNGAALGKDKISDFRLVAGNNIQSRYHQSIIIRVCIPEDLELHKSSCDPYSTTYDDRVLDELDYDILIWHEDSRKWKKHNEFKGIKPCDVSRLLLTSKESE